MPRHRGVALPVAARLGQRLLYLKVAAPHHQVGAQQGGDALHQLRRPAQAADRGVVEMAVVVVQGGILALRGDDHLAHYLFPQRRHPLGREQLEGAEHAVPVVCLHLGGGQRKAQASDERSAAHARRVAALRRKVNRQGGTGAAGWSGAAGGKMNPHLGPAAGGVR